LTAQIYYS